MGIIVNGQHIKQIYTKGGEVKRIYDHGRLVYESSIPDYLCFTALESGTFTLTIPAAVTSTYLSYVEYSLDGQNWTRLTVDDTAQSITTPTVAQGGKVYWRGSGVCMNDSTHASINYCSVFTQTEDTPNFVASGNLVSLIALSDFDYEVRNACAFANLFFGNEKLTDAETLILPMFSTAATYLFYMTFKNCSNLAKAPILNLTRTTSNCCFEMFRGTALTTMPELPDIALSSYCYSGMFRETNIEKAVLPSSATTLVTSCYSNIFYGCTNLKYVKCLATDISATNCVYNWLNGVSSTGTFIQAEGVTWPRGASGIPTGWLAYDEGEEIPNDYTPCDYIYNSSTGGGGVDLGFKFRILDYSVEAKFKQDEINNGMVCGTNASDSGAIWYYNYTVRGSFRVYTCYSGTWMYDKEGFTPIDTDIHTIRYVGDADGCYQISDGTQSTSTNISTWAADESTNNLFIFGRAVSSNTYKGRIYYLKVWNTATEEVICNLIPCSRKSDGAAGFWDTAQKQFFTSTYWTAHFDNE